MKLVVLSVSAFLLPLTAAGQQTSQFPTQPSVRPPYGLEQYPGYHREAAEESELEQVHRRLLGARFCGDHVVTASTFIDAAASNDTGTEQAFAVRWLERARGSSTVHTAIFTPRRCIVSDFDSADDGKVIVHVVGDSLSVTRDGYVFYEAYFVNRREEALMRREWRRAVFCEHSLSYELDQGKLGRRTDAGPDFFLSPEGGIIPRPEFVLGVAATPGRVLPPLLLRPGSLVPFPMFQKDHREGEAPHGQPEGYAQPAPPRFPPQGAASNPLPKMPVKKLPSVPMNHVGCISKILGKSTNPCPTPAPSGQGAKQ